MEQLSFFNRLFWDLVLMKVVKNLASVKYQWLLLLYIPVVWGMFNFKPGTTEPWISDVVGCGGLFGGFVTLAGSRLIANISLSNKGDLAGYYEDSKNKDGDKKDIDTDD